MRIRSASRIEEVEEYENEEEQYQQKVYKEIEKYVNSLTQQELRERLILYMVDEKQRRYWRFADRNAYINIQSQLICFHKPRKR